MSSEKISATDIWVSRTIGKIAERLGSVFLLIVLVSIGAFIAIANIAKNGEDKNATWYIGGILAALASTYIFSIWVVWQHYRRDEIGANQIYSDRKSISDTPKPVGNQEVEHQTGSSRVVASDQCGAEPPGRDSAHTERPIDKEHMDSFGSELSDIETTALKIHSNIKVAANLNYRFLLREIEYYCNEFRVRTDEWARGQLRATPERYNQAVLEVYRNAKSSIECTSVMDYESTWTSQLGAEILQTHDESNASVTRIFIFSFRSDLDAEKMEIMRAHQQHANVQVLVYFDKEEEMFSFPGAISRDFTIIDSGRIVGVADFYSGEKRQATWHFNNEGLKKLVLDSWEQLKKQSETYDQVEKWWRIRSE